MQVFQYVTDYSKKDGIGSDISGFHSVLTSNNISSKIFCLHSHVTNKIVFSLKHLREFRFYNSDIHIIHYGGYGLPLHEILNLPGKKVLRFHNITPSRFFDVNKNVHISAQFALSEVKAYLELRKFREFFSAFLFPSNYNYYSFQYNVGEINRKKSLIIPIVRRYNQEEIFEYKKLSYRLGFVGRFAPNKKIEDILRLLYFLKKRSSEYSLHLLGTKPPVFSSYYNYLNSFAKSLSLQKSLHIKLNVSEESLDENLKNFDVYVSMSEHEGFGIPILEAFSRRIPTFAFANAAIPEIMRNAGVLFYAKDFNYLAELIHTINLQEVLKKRIITTQDKVIDHYNSIDFDGSILKLLNFL